MKLAVMQPYFFPYIGYFQLIGAVDEFVLYDNIKYVKKGWITRNRMLQNGKDVVFSLSLKKDSDFLDVRDRELAPTFDRGKLLSQIRGTYHGAPYFKQAFPLVEQIVNYGETNLFRFLHHSITRTCENLRIPTRIRISSEIGIDHALKSQEKVLAFCAATGATTYINAIGGMELYRKEAFQEQRVELKFIKSEPLEYPQFGSEFVPWLSIIDVLMFNDREKVAGMLSRYELI